MKFKPMKMIGKTAKLGNTLKKASALPKKSKSAQKKALGFNPGSYPKGDYRQGMPRVQMNLKKLREKNKIITSLD